MNTRDISDKAHEFKERAKELGAKVQEWQEKAADTARDVGAKTDAYVRENTWTTIAAAALIGCVVGFLIAGGRRSEPEED